MFEHTTLVRTLDLIVLIDTDANLLTLVGWLVTMVRVEPKPPLNLPHSASKDIAGWEDALTN